MKKKMFIAVGLVCLAFIVGGVYIVTTIETATSELDQLIMLHRVEILREHLLIQIKNAQSDFYLMGTRYERPPKTVLANIKKMESVSVTCFDCHHSPRVVRKLKNLNSDIDVYKNSINTIMRVKGNRPLLMQESETAYHTAEKLMTAVDTMVHIGSSKLAARTASSLKNISRSKSILYALVVMTPFIAAGLCFGFIREFTKPVQGLLTATRRLKSGDMDYRIEGLKDEFGEVATSFNEMSASLKQNMLKIQESERRYRTLFESAGDAIFIVEAEGDRRGDIVDANRAAAEMHGYRIDELLQLNLIKDLDVPEAAQEAPERIGRILNGEWIKAEIDHRKKDGSVFPVEISAGLLQHMGHKYILAIDRDISERKKMETLVLHSKLEWEDTFNTITDMITIHDRDFNITRANKAAEKILGVTFLEETQVKCYRYYHGMDSPPKDCPSCECYVTGEPAAFEMYEPHLDMFLEIRAMPRFDHQRRVSGVIHVIRDITERKRVDAALQRAEQLKLVGEWSAGLAHEIKNPLAGIKGSIQVILDEPGLAEDDRSMILKAVDEIKRIETLLKSLLNFAKPPQLQLMPTDLNDLLNKTIDFALKHPSLSANSAIPLKVFKDFATRLPKTLADPMQLQQVFLNLMFNAIEAMQEGGALAVKTSYDDKLNSIQITIADTGKGIEQSMLDKIFKPFFTTKHKGSGLGLAITRRLIEEHGGEIYVESTPDKGTVFTISLLVNHHVKEQVL